MTRTSAASAAVAASGKHAQVEGFGIQPHGLVLVVREPQLRVVQASTNAAALLGLPLDRLLLATLRQLGGNLETRLRERLAVDTLALPQRLPCSLGPDAAPHHFEGCVHRAGGRTLVLELEPLRPEATRSAPDGGGNTPLDTLSPHLRQLASATTPASLAELTARALQELCAFDRVLVYELAADGPGQVVAESRSPQLASWIGKTLAALEPPPAQRAWRLRQRVQWLADAAAAPCPLVPESQPGPGGTVDLSATTLLAPPEAQARALRELGLSAQLSVAVVHDGALWGLLLGLHIGPRKLRRDTLAAADLLAEVMATRLAALECHARAQVAEQMRALERRLLEASAFDADWPQALFSQPQTLLAPLSACGAVLWHEGECHSCGTVPAAADLAALLQRLDGCAADESWQGHALAREDRGSHSRAQRTAGVLSVRLARAPGHHLAWLRPTLPWSRGEIELATACGRELAALILRVNAVRLMIAESQLASLRAAVAETQEAVLVFADTTQGGFYANDAFCALAGCRPDSCATLHTLTALFADDMLAQWVMGQVRAERRAWQGELVLRRPDGRCLPLFVRGEPVSAGSHGVLGSIFIFQDVSASQRIERVRSTLDAALRRTSHRAPAAAGSPGGRALVGAIIANASLAAMDIADSGATPEAASMLQDVHDSMVRATELSDRIRLLSDYPP